MVSSAYREQQAAIRKMLVQTTFGNENFQRSSAKAQVFACRTLPFSDGPERERQLWAAARDNWHVSRHGSLSKVPAAAGYRDEMGKWSTAQYEVPDGMILKPWAQRKLEAQVAGRHLIAAMLVQVREGAPIQRIVVNLTGDSRATYQAITLLEGRFDIISLATACGEGYSVNPGNVTQFQQYNADAMFNVTILSPGTIGRPVVDDNVVTNSQGQQVRVRTRHRRRAIQV